MVQTIQRFRRNRTHSPKSGNPEQQDESRSDLPHRRTTRTRLDGMEDKDIHARIAALVAEEHTLRSGQPSPEEHARLTELEVSLDQCWDLLRQRRARREVGEDPSAAEVRPAGEVEGYRQ